LHIPLQAGEDNVLARMRRKYTTAEFAEKIRRIREIMPDVAITTDLIVGFPGETDEMYRAGFEYIRDLGFSELHVFPYSKRTGTPAAKYEDQVDEEVKNERVHALIDLSETFQLEYARQFVGQVLEVIPEREAKGREGAGLLAGHSDNYITLVFAGSSELIGKVCRVRVTEAGVNESRGELVGVVEKERVG
jgi:threonylcarbamoyladenosine tRNA methylthiotransferase MtaB